MKKEWAVLCCLLACGCEVAHARPLDLDRERAEVAAIVAVELTAGGDVAPEGERVPRSKCAACNGTGKVGDGRVFVECLACYDDAASDASIVETPIVETSAPVCENGVCAVPRGPVARVVKAPAVVATAPIRGVANVASRVRQVRPARRLIGRLFGRRR